MAKAKDKGRKGRAGADVPAISVSAHPRGNRAVNTMKSWGGLLGFALVAFLSARAGVEPFEIGLRALAGGLVGFVVAWGVGVAVWRQLIVGELRADANRRREERERREAEAAAEAGEAGEGVPA